MNSLTDYEVFRKMDYRPFKLNGQDYKLSTYPYLDIVLGDTCNAKCRFCIAHLVHQRLCSTLAEQKRSIDYAIKTLGVREVLLVGGEPTIYSNLFDYTSYLREYRKAGMLNKVCMTTNGHKLVTDPNFLKSLLGQQCLTHLNLSLMTLDKQKQSYINGGSKIYVGLKELEKIYNVAQLCGVHLRINNNIFLDNNDSVSNIINFYNEVAPYCDSVKFSPLFKTDAFSTVNEVTEFNRKHTLSDDHYDYLWHGVEESFEAYPIVRNKMTFRFVEYSMIVLPTPLILNYNQHGQLRRKVIEEHEINSLKVLPTGDLSLSWNREEKDFFIPIPEEV